MLRDIGSALRRFLLGMAAACVAGGVAFLGAGVGLLLGLANLELLRGIFPGAISAAIEAEFLFVCVAVCALAGVLGIAHVWRARARQSRDGREDAVLSYIDRLQL